MLKSRSGSAGHSAPPPPQSIEAVRRRARHRLIGAAILVLLGVLGFPLLFDTQPRPIAVDIPIEIPSRNATPAPMSAKPAPAAASAKAVATVANGPAAKEQVVTENPVAPTPAPEPVKTPSDKAATVEKAPPVEKKQDPAAPPVADKPVAKTAVKAAERPADNTSDKAAAADKTDTKDKASGNERIVVQVGAFAEEARARDVRLKLERAGLKTYTHVANTPQGKRIRVRLGPFATKAEAEKAALKAKSLGLQTTLLWL